MVPVESEPKLGIAVSNAFSSREAVSTSLGNAWYPTVTWMDLTTALIALLAGVLIAHAVYDQFS
jgi:hypothetical protein